MGTGLQAGKGGRGVSFMDGASAWEDTCSGDDREHGCTRT